MAEERGRLGKSRAEMAHACASTPQAIGQFERGANYPGGAVLAEYAKVGADVQYILTGVHSENLDKVAEDAGTYHAEGVGALSKEEEKLVEMFRHISPGERANFKGLIASVASAKMKKDKTG